MEERCCCTEGETWRRGGDGWSGKCETEFRGYSVVVGGGGSKSDECDSTRQCRAGDYARDEWSSNAEFNGKRGRYGEGSRVDKLGM